MRAIAIYLALAAPVACLRDTAFRCLHDSDCGSSGTCEPIGYCSTPDTECPGTGRSYTDSAGQGLSNTCVPTGAPGPGPDAGAPPPDSTTAGCPSDYVAVTGLAHRYKLLDDLSWDDARAACALIGGAGYLAVPDDATELTGLAGLAAPPFWIGIDDKGVPGMFVTQKGGRATFLPWRPGEPSGGPPPEECVDAVSPTEIATDKCASRRNAVCECAP